MKLREFEKQNIFQHSTPLIPIFPKLAFQFLNLFHNYEAESRKTRKSAQQGLAENQNRPNGLWVVRGGLNRDFA
jgi:hypothetical protein